MKQVFLCFLVTMVLLVNAQGIQHIVKSGENLSTIANQYKVSVANILAANNINSNALLKVGQKLVIPTGNVAIKPAIVAKPNIAAKPAAVSNSKQHVVVAGETLGKIARLYNLTEKDLKTWNNLATDLIKIGQIISLVNTGINPPQVAVKKPVIAKPVATKPVVTENVITPKVEDIVKDIVPDAKPIAPITKPVIEESKPITEPVVKKIEEATNKVIEEVKPITKPAPAVDKPALMPAANVSISSANATSVGNSFFEQEFKASGASNTLNCKSFKTSAGWQDKKYYALTNLVEAGTIIKITANNKTTYAKVLGVLPDTNNNTEIPIRISSATAQQLGLDFNGISAVLIEY